MTATEEITYTYRVPHENTEQLEVTIEAADDYQAKITLDDGDHRVTLTGDEFDEVAAIVARFRKMRAAKTA